MILPLVGVDNKGTERTDGDEALHVVYFDFEIDSFFPSCVVQPSKDG